MSDPATANNTSPAGGAVPLAAGAAPAAPPPARSIVTAARLITFTIVCGLLFWGKVVAIPLALGVLFSFMLHPVVQRLQRIGLPRTPSVIVTVLFACGVLACLSWVIGSQLLNLGEELPDRKQAIVQRVKEIRDMMRGGAVENIQDAMKTVAEELDKDAAATARKEGGAESEQQGGLFHKTTTQKPQPVYLETPQKILDFEGFSALLPVLDSLATAGLVLLLVFLLLLRWEDMRSRLISFSGHRNLTVATRACDDAGRRIIRYLMMQLIVNGSYGLAAGIGFYFMGLEYAALWGLCAALFRYVPYVGPVVGAVLPITYSFITAGSWEQPLWVAGFIIVLELISNNIIEPWLYGANLGLSATGIIMSAVAWTFLWGPVGLVMSTPLTVCLVVLGEYMPAFAIFTRLLGDKPVMEPHFQFYQRLLARDEVEATELAADFVDERSLPESADELFIPALALASRDREAGLLEPEEVTYVAAATGRVMDAVHLAEAEREEREKLKEEKQREKEKEKALEKGETGSFGPEAAAAAAVAESSARRVRPAPVIVWPVNEFAGVAANLIDRHINKTIAETILLTPQTLLGEAGQEIRARQPAVVCVVSLAGSDVTRVKSYVRKLRADFPGLPVVAARLGLPGTLTSEMRQLLHDAGAAAVSRTITETAGALQPYAADAATVVSDEP